MLKTTKSLLSILLIAGAGYAHAENLWAGIDNQYGLEEVEILAVVPMPKEPEVLVVEPTIEYNKPVTLDVKFEFDKDVIIPQYYAILSEMAEFIKANNAQALIEGHTDSKGSLAYNQDLSERRARAVKDFMVRGWDLNPHDIQVVGRGETVPVASNDTDEGRAQNRRVIAVAMKLRDNPQPGVSSSPQQGGYGYEYGNQSAPPYLPTNNLR